MDKKRRTLLNTVAAVLLVVAIFLLPRRLVIDRAQLLARRQARDGLRVPRLQQRPVEQPADAHHIKFIEIRAVDGQKLQPLIARQRLVGRLGPHAAVE